jgi:hypothetical protein
MGYYATIEMTGVIIPKENVQKCLDAINALHSDSNLQSKASGGTSGGPAVPVRERRWYAWVGNPVTDDGFISLADALRSWRHEPEQGNDGSVEIVRFMGEKWGDDETLYHTIAPFVKDGGSIACKGEDGSLWAYDFRNGKLVQLTGHIVYT